jgi:hypothetical protein
MLDGIEAAGAKLGSASTLVHLVDPALTSVRSRLPRRRQLMQVSPLKRLSPRMSLNAEIPGAARDHATRVQPGSARPARSGKAWATPRAACASSR